MNRARVVDAGKKGSLAAIGAALIAVGIGLIEEGQNIEGGIIAGVGAVLLAVASYVGR